MLLATVVVTLFCSVSGAFETTVQGRTQLEADWLFQADGNPTLETVNNEINYTRELIVRISAMQNAPNLSEETKKLDALEVAANGDAQTQYLAVRNLKRTIFFKNPLIDFDRVLLIDNPYPKGNPLDTTDEWNHESRHRNGFMAVDGGRLLVVGLHPGSEVTSILPDLKGSFWRPDLSFDGSEILISYRPVGERSFHLYRCNADGSNFRQLTYGDYDDLDPVFAPDGKIIFCSSRQHSYVRCMPMTHSFAISRCDGDGKNIYVISANGEPEYLPSILDDGRVIFTRWEYTDKALWRVQSLWTCNPDGTNTQTFWGNQSFWPDVPTEARSIPGTNKVMFTAVGHHIWFDGSIGIIDPSEGLNYPDGLTRVTREAEWPEGATPGEPPPAVEYYQSGKIHAYHSPYPLSEEYFLVSAREGTTQNGYESHNDWYFRLYLMDIYGNKELIFRGEYNAYYAIPFKPRQMPPVLVDRVQWPKIGSGEKPALGTLFSNDVFAGAPEILKEKGKAIRVVQMDPKTYTTWNKLVQHDGPAVSITQADGVKRILGTVPIESDGSIAFQVPPGEAIFFEMLDAEGRAIHVMRSFTNVMPGEVRGCHGCHESKLTTSVTATAGLAMMKGAQLPVPPPWGVDESVSFVRFAQPVFDKHCADCHQNPEHEAYAKLNLTLRPSMHPWYQQWREPEWVYSQSGVSPFMEPYLSLVSGPMLWAVSQSRDERNVPKNLAGVLIVEGYGNDPNSIMTLPPYSAFSPVSQIVHNAMSGEHHGVKVTGIDLERLIAWVDLNGPYLGDEEIRNEMFDPISYAIENIPPVRPRVATAPKINRFDLRQDGDTSVAVLGELKLMPNRVPDYNPHKVLDEYKHQELLREIEKEKDMKIEILAANYGGNTEDQRIDVIQQLQKAFHGTRFIPIESYHEAFTDPAQQVVKHLRIEYKIDDGPVKHVRFNEGERIVLPK